MDAAGFNVAAPAQARNESEVSEGQRTEAAPLQRGRAPAGAGMLSAAQHQIHGIELLQRGRGRAGAACAGKSPDCPRYRGFNVAAPARARNVPQNFSGLGLNKKPIQRGRARAGAECAPKMYRVGVKYKAASTWPRPPRRGMNKNWPINWPIN